ncbi:hypothetical protein [Amaricoccus macauensis]|uniref:hypothetical protein n=1 Tax=Amaricoccus macauensis TaxID=57001 RepID=UPI003C7C5332
MTRTYLFATFALTLAPISLHAQEGVMRMCAERDPPEICTCATERLQAELSPDDFALYDRIGTDYMNRKESGESMTEAWDAAVAGAGSRISVTNTFGRAHRDAINECSG